MGTLIWPRCVNQRKRADLTAWEAPAQLQLDSDLWEVVMRKYLQHCPGQKPPFLAINYPVRPYKSTNAPHKNDSLCKTLRTLNAPGGSGQSSSSAFPAANTFDV